MSGAAPSPVHQNISLQNVQKYQDYHSRSGEQEVRQLLGLPVGEEPVVPVHTLDVAVGHGGLILTPLTGLVTHHLVQVLPPVIQNVLAQVSCKQSVSLKNWITMNK